MSASVSLGATIRRANSGFVAMLRCYALRRLCHPERKCQCDLDRGVPRRLPSTAEKVGHLFVAAPSSAAELDRFQTFPPPLTATAAKAKQNYNVASCVTTFALP